MIWEEYTFGSFPFATWTAATGSLVINTDNFITYDTPSVYSVRITGRNNVSLFEDSFKLSLRDKCRDVTLTSGVVVKAADSSLRTEANPF